MMPATQPIQDPIAEALRLIHPREGDAYAILDAARAGRVLRLLKSTNLDRLILYEGEIDPLIAEVAPYLVRLTKGSTDTRRIVEAAWGNSWGVFLSSRASIEAARRHLRIFLTVMTEQRKKLLFRFYDPRVLRPYLPSCTPAELNTFFGPVDQYLVEGEDPGEAQVHKRENQEFRALTVALRAEA
jgi:hypothetical protein